MKSVRIERINSEIQKAISHIIDNEIRDPQIDAIISVSNVETTPDLSYCRVYITSIGTTPSGEVLARIKGAAGFIRGKLSNISFCFFLHKVKQLCCLSTRNKQNACCHWI